MISLIKTGLFTAKLITVKCFHKPNTLSSVHRT